MKHFFVLLDFKSKHDADLDRFAETVLKNLSGNPVFEPIKTLVDVDLRNAVTAYNSALIANETGGKPTTATKNEKRAALLVVLDLVARNVDLIAQGNEPLILETGFAAGGRIQHIPKEIAKANIKQAKRGDAPCEVDLEVERLAAAELFAVEWSADQGQNWNNGTYSSKRKFKLLTTAPKTDTLIRVRGLGRKERKGPWSEPVSLFIV